MRATANLRWESVVRMASAKSPRPSASAAATSPGTAASMRSAGSGTPMMPVEFTSTSPGIAPVAAATARAMRRASSTPRVPVRALALPELTSRPRQRPPVAARWSAERSIGAARTRLRVNIAAAVAAGSARISPRSKLPPGLMPQAVPAARKPAGHGGTSVWARVVTAVSMVLADAGVIMRATFRGCGRRARGAGPSRSHRSGRCGDTGCSPAGSCPAGCRSWCERSRGGRRSPAPG